MGVLQLVQRERGEIMDIPAGILLAQTLAKLPSEAPRMKNHIAETMLLRKKKRFSKETPALVTAFLDASFSEFL